MKRFKLFNKLAIPVLLIQSCMGCWAQTVMPSKNVEVGLKQENQIDPNDLEVIKNMGLLEDWDIVGPGGPVLDKKNLSNIQDLPGDGHAK